MRIEEADTACTLGKSMMAGVGEQAILSHPVDGDLASQTAADQESAVR